MMIIIFKHEGQTYKTTSLKKNKDVTHRAERIKFSPGPPAIDSIILRAHLFHDSKALIVHRDKFLLWIWQ